MNTATDKLGRALSILYDMELNNYLMEKSIRSLNAQISSLGHAKTVRKATPKKFDSSFVSFWEVIMFYGTGILFIIGAFYGFTSGGSRFLSCLLGAIKFGFIFAIVFLAVTGVILFLYDSFVVKRKDQEIEQRVKDNYNRDIKNEEIRMKQEKRKKDFLIQQRDALISRKSYATQKLNQFYDLVGIDHKYRKLIPIGYMHEFYRLRIATKLEGADGLYYLVRKELRDDQFAATLNEISSKLDTIINNQYGMIDKLNEMNSKCNVLISNAEKTAAISSQNNKLLSEVAQNTSITAYNTTRIKEEAQYQSFMTMYYG